MASSTPSSGGVPDKRSPSEKSTYRASTVSDIHDARAPMSSRTRAAILSVGAVRTCIGENVGTVITTVAKRGTAKGICHATAVRVTPATRDWVLTKDARQPNYADSAARWSTPDLAVEEAEHDVRALAAGPFIDRAARTTCRRESRRRVREIAVPRKTQRHRREQEIIRPRFLGEALWCQIKGMAPRWGLADHPLLGGNPEIGVDTRPATFRTARRQRGLAGHRYVIPCGTRHMSPGPSVQPMILVRPTAFTR
jgi:hypothetical protein